MLWLQINYFRMHTVEHLKWIFLCIAIYMMLHSSFTQFLSIMFMWKTDFITITKYSTFYCYVDAIFPVINMIDFLFYELKLNNFYIKYIFTSFIIHFVHVYCHWWYKPNDLTLFYPVLASLARITVSNHTSSKPTQDFGKKTPPLTS